ncbi:MAG: hypothetical protein WC819_01940 [Parcubacteria group bacterium]
MELKDKGFVVMMFLVIFGGIGYSYWHFVIDRGYILVYHDDCDPTVEICYVWECDPDAVDEEEKCTGNPEEDVWYYTHLERLAKNVPECNVDDADCDPFACDDGEEDCGEVTCTEETAKVDEVTCSDPETYINEHPEALLEDEEGEEEELEEGEGSVDEAGVVEGGMIEAEDGVVADEGVEAGEDNESADMTDKDMVVSPEAND